MTQTRLVLLVAIVSAIVVSSQALFYQADDPCRFANYDYLTQLCCDGVIYVDPEFVYTCCGSNVCYAINRTLANPGNMKVIGLAKTKLSIVERTTKAPLQFPPVWALINGQPRSEIIPKETTVAQGTTTTEMPAVELIDKLTNILAKNPNYFSGLQSDPRNMTVRDIFRDPFGAVIPGIEGLSRMKIINETQTTTTANANDEERREISSEEEEKEEENVEEEEIVVKPEQNGTNQNSIPQHQFKPIPIPIVYPEWKFQKLPTFSLNRPGFFQPDVFCDGINLSELLRANPYLACCANMVIFDRRSYQCTQNPNGKHSVQATTKFPPTTTAETAAATEEVGADNDEQQQQEGTTEQPLMVEVAEETTASEIVVPSEDTTQTPDSTTANSINLPSHFTPIPCLNRVYYVEPSIAGVFTCCGEDIQDLRFEFCFSPFFSLPGAHGPHQFRVMPLDVSKPTTRNRLDCGASISFIFPTKEAMSPFSC